MMTLTLSSHVPSQRINFDTQIGLKVSLDGQAIAKSMSRVVLADLVDHVDVNEQIDLEHGIRRKSYKIKLYLHDLREIKQVYNVEVSKIEECLEVNTF